MRKILMFFIVFGIFIGIVIGVSNELNTEPIIDDTEVQDNHELIPKLRLPLSGVDTYNPLLTQNEHISDILKLIYEPLFEYDEQNQLTPCLAQEYFKRGDNSWVVRIKSNVKWHNGTEFKASDVVFTVNYLLDETINSVYKANVKNVLKVEELDSETVVFTLNEDDPHIISKLCFPIISSKNSFVVDDVLNKMPNCLIGTGPYKYIMEDENKLLLNINEEWWNIGNYNLEEIELIHYATYAEAVKGFKSTEVDLIMTDMHSWKEKFGFIGINSHSFESSIYEVIIPNTSKSALSESSVRKAILHSINRPNIVSNIYEENATIKDIPIPSYSKYKTESTEYNIEKAKQMLVNAGWKYTNGAWKKENKTLSFNMLVTENNQEQLLVAEKIKSDLQEIGIKITIKKVSWDAMKTNLKNGNFDLALTTLDIKNEYQLQNIVGTADIYNYAKYSNLLMEDILLKLMTSQDEAYDENMQSFITMYLNEMAYIGLYFKNNTILSNKSVKGEYKSIASDPYKNIINFYK